MDSLGKTTDSLLISKKDIERYDSATKKWKTQTMLVYSNYQFDENGNLHKVSYGFDKDDIKTITYNKSGKIISDEINFYYEKEYDSLGVLTKQVDYDWKTKEIQTLIYQNGQLNRKIVVFDKNNIWNSDGTITQKPEKNNSDSKSDRIETSINLDDTDYFSSISKGRGYKIEADYYTNGQIKSFISKDGRLTQYTENGVLVKETTAVETIKMNNID